MSDLVVNTEDLFSRVAAHTVSGDLLLFTPSVWLLICVLYMISSAGIRFLCQSSSAFRIYNVG